MSKFYAHTCRYILRPAREGVVAIYCDKSVGYTNEINDETGRRQRKYKSFCQEHEGDEDDDDFYN